MRPHLARAQVRAARALRALPRALRLGHARRGRREPARARALLAGARALANVLRHPDVRLLGAHASRLLCRYAFAI